MIVVTTPTGRVGSRVVQLLVQAGVRPRVLVRDPDKLDAATRTEVEVVRADQTDPEAVVRGTHGADCLFWVNPPAQDDDPVAAQAHLGANAARAVVDNGIARTVFLSSVGAEKRSGAGDIDGLARTEEQLDATGMSVLHLRCGYFFTNLLMELESLRAGVLRTPWPLEHAMPWVDPRDVGEVVAARVLAGGWSGRAVQAVHGPADLTFPQVAETLTNVLGYRVTAEHLSQEDFRMALRSAGLEARQVEAVADMSAGLSGGFVPENKRSVRTTTPTTLAAWAQARLAPAL